MKKNTGWKVPIIILVGIVAVFFTRYLWSTKLPE